MSINYGVTTALLLLMMFMQIRNFVKFRATNGANVMRVLIFMSTASMCMHSVRHLLNHHQDGAFFMTSIIIYLSMYFKPDEWHPQK